MSKYEVPEGNRVPESNHREKFDSLQGSLKDINKILSSKDLVEFDTEELLQLVQSRQEIEKKMREMMGRAEDEGAAANVELSKEKYKEAAATEKLAQAQMELQEAERKVEEALADQQAARAMQAKITGKGGDDGLDKRKGFQKWLDVTGDELAEIQKKGEYPDESA